jgi:chemotaxis protein histidine kinase CheA
MPSNRDSSSTQDFFVDAGIRDNLPRTGTKRKNLDPHEDDIGSEETMNAEEAEEAEEEFNYEFEEDPYPVEPRRVSIETESQEINSEELDSDIEVIFRCIPPKSKEMEEAEEEEEEEESESESEEDSDSDSDFEMETGSSHNEDIPQDSENEDQNNEKDKDKEDENLDEESMNFEQKQRTVMEYLKQNKTNRFFNGDCTPEFMSKAEDQEMINLRTRFRYEYEQFKKEHQDDEASIKKFIRDWRPTKQERKRVKRISNLSAWKTSTINLFDFFVYDEEAKDYVLAKKKITRRVRNDKEELVPRPGKRRKGTNFSVILSKSDIPSWLNWAHADKHWANKKMRKRLNGVYWVNYEKDVDDWIQMCPVCEESKPNDIVPPLKSIISQRPRQRIELDFMDIGEKNRDPVTRTRYVLLFVDCFTKRAWLRPFVSKHAENVARTCYSIFKNDKNISKVQSDNGGEFKNAYLQAVVEKKLGGKLIHPPPYQPWNDGQIERLVRTFKGNIKQHIRVNGKNNWPQILKKLEYDYNTTQHESHDFAPFELEFVDYKAKNLFSNPAASDRILKAIEYFQTPDIPYDERIAIAKENLVESARKMVTQFNKKATNKIFFNPGDIVRVCDFRNASKKTRRGTQKTGFFLHSNGSEQNHYEWIQVLQPQMDR